MALTFPANPTNGQRYSNYIYDSSALAWRNVNSSEGIGLQYTSGLVPIIPTSITVNAGSGSVGVDGLISVTGASSLTINGCFSSIYNNYYVIAAFTSATGGDADIQTQLTGPSTPGYSTLGSGYLGARYGYYNNAAAGTWYASQGSATIARMTNTYGCSFTCTITNPGSSIANKRWMSQTIDQDFAMTTAFRNTSSGVAYTGMNIFTASPTFTGTVKIYGYR